MACHRVRDIPCHRFRCESVTHGHDTWGQCIFPRHPVVPTYVHQHRLYSYSWPVLGMDLPLCFALQYSRSSALLCGVTARTMPATEAIKSPEKWVVPSIILFPKDTLR